MPKPEFAGIGIDLLSLSRAKRFLGEHSRDEIKRLLTPAERAAYLDGMTPDCFCRLFTAKEAFYKACPSPPLPAGLQAFAAIEVKLLPQDRFRVKFLQSSISGPSYEGEGCFFCCQEYRGAQIMIWHEARVQIRVE